MRQSAISINKFSKTFKDHEVIKDLDLEVQKGEIFGFLGRNGAGKSTLIHSITGINYLSSGSFSILGNKNGDIEKIKKLIGVMPDTSNLYQHMNAFDFLMYMNELKGKKESKENINSLLNDVGLGNTGKKKIKSFSFGMKKKVSIAQALLGNPKLIILDEPTSGLDPESAINIQKLMLKLNKSGKTIFLTSHNLEEIEKMCDRVAIMHQGKIQKVGTVRDLKNSFIRKKRISIQSYPLLGESDLQEFNYEGISIVEFTKESTVIEITGEETIPDLLAYMVNKNMKIYGIDKEEVTLEEVFLAN